MKRLKVYRAILKKGGWSGLIKKSGKPVAIALFTFFLLKGLLWLFLLYGGFELIFWLSRASLVDFYILLLQSLNLFKILGPVAQWLEQGTHNPLVGGSNPSGPTKTPSYNGGVFSWKTRCWIDCNWLGIVSAPNFRNFNSLKFSFLSKTKFPLSDRI